jgi:hypothetical protein
MVQTGQILLLIFKLLNMIEINVISSNKKVLLILIMAFLLSGLQKEIFSNEKKVFISDFGAKPDGQTLNTEFIQKAIDSASNQPNGGTVVFTNGKWLSGSLILKSNVTLFLEDGAILLGSTNPNDYRKIEIPDAPVSPRGGDNSRLALLLAFDAENVSIKGRGTIDGQGRVLALVIDSLHHTGEQIDPNYNVWNGRPSETARPKIINFMKCKNVNVSDVTIKNSACWVQTYELCTDLKITGITVESRAYWNNDGINIVDCKNVIISGCDVNSADDGICLKSYYTGYYNDNILIENCTVRSSASAVKFGTASIGGFKNIKIDNIRVLDTFRSAIAIESVDGGFIENVTVSNIFAYNTGNAIFIRLGHRFGERPGTVKNITIKDMDVQVPFGRPDEKYDMRGPALPFFHNQFPAPICGIPEASIENLTLENITIQYPGRASKAMAYIPLWRLDEVPEKIKDYPEYTMFGELPSWGFYVRHVNGLTMKNITLRLDDEDYRPAIIFDDVSNLNLEKIRLPKDNGSQIILKNTKNIQIDPPVIDYLREL